MQVLENGSSTVLAIKKIQTSCPCIKAEYDTKLIAPKGIANLTVSVDFANRTKNLHGNVFVTTDSGTNSVKAIPVEAILPEAKGLTASPNPVYIGVVHPGEEVHQTLIFQVPEELVPSDGLVPKDFVLKRSADWISFQAVEFRGNRIIVHLVVKVPLGLEKQFRERVGVENTKLKEDLEIPVNGLIAERIEIAPSLLYVSPAQTEYTLQISSTEDAIPVLERYSSQNDMFSVEECRQMDDRKHLLTCRLRRTCKPGTLARGSLSLYWVGEKTPTKVEFVSPP